MMTGEKQIIAIRKRGFKPAAIFIEVGLTPPVARYRFQDPEKQIEIGSLPTVHLSLHEARSPLDLRFVVGCRVHVHAREMGDAILHFAEKVAAAGAAQVVVCCLDSPEIIAFKNGQWSAM